MDEWKRGIWGTVGVALVLLALSGMGAWYVGTANTTTVVNGIRSYAPQSYLNPFIICGGIVSLIGLYMLGAALSDWPLPGRAKARQHRADEEKFETLMKERSIRTRDQLCRLIEDARLVESHYLASREPLDESVLAHWSSDARACISNIDVKLVRAFDQERAPGSFRGDERALQTADVIELLNARASFLVELSKQV